MKVRDLKGTIDQIEAIFEEAGAKAAAADFAELRLLFEGHEDESVDDFVRSLRELYVKAPRETAKPAEASNQVQSYVEKLKSFENNDDAFMELTEQLKADKSIGKDDMNEIQRLYVGGREAWPSRQAAWESIVKTFTWRKYQKAAISNIESANPW